MQQRRPTEAEGKAYLTWAQSDPVGWCKEVLGVEFWPEQAAILEAIRDNPFVTARSCHGIGKSFLAGNASLWFLNSFPNSIVLTTAPTWRQVEKLIWKEIRQSFKKAKYRLCGDLMPKAPEIQVEQDSWCALGISTNDPDRFQGFHAEHLLVIGDEAAGINEEIFEAIWGVLTSEHCVLFLPGNPTKIGGTFYKSHREPGWAKFHISAFNTPNFQYFGISEEDIWNNSWEQKITEPLPAPWLVTPQWVANMKRWGRDSPVWQARVLGDFPSQGERNVIPLAWIEAAVERWHMIQENSELKAKKVKGSHRLGVDVARYGDDDTVILARQGSFIHSLQSFSKQDTRETAGHVLLKHREVDAEYILVDVIGLGAGVVDSLNEEGAPVVAVNVAEAPTPQEDEEDKLSSEKHIKPRFFNLRSELWWKLREDLDPQGEDPLALPPDDELMADLANPLYSIDGKGRIVIEPKEKTKERLGHSPDRGDALMLTEYQPPEEPEWNFGEAKPTSAGSSYQGPI